MTFHFGMIINSANDVCSINNLLLRLYVMYFPKLPFKVNYSSNVKLLDRSSVGIENNLSLRYRRYFLCHVLECDSRMKYAPGLFGTRLTCYFKFVTSVDSRWDLLQEKRWIGKIVIILMQSTLINAVDTHPRRQSFLSFLSAEANGGFSSEIKSLAILATTETGHHFHCLPLTVDKPTNERNHWIIRQFELGGRDAVMGFRASPSAFFNLSRAQCSIY